MGFTAMWLAASENFELTKSGFNTEDEALAYITENICKVCQNLIGTTTDEYDSGYYYEDALATDCGAEWCIVTDKEYESYGNGE